MSLYKFDRNSVFTNTLRLYPEVKLVVYAGESYYNSTPAISGAFTDPIRLTGPGNISLYELNVDRNEISSPTRTIGTDAVDNRNIIYPWIVKDGSRLNFRTSTTEAFVSTPIGSIITGSLYPYTASISKEYYTSITPRSTPAVISQSTPAPVVTSPGSVSNLLALQNTINYYRLESPHFEYSSSADSVSSGVHNRDFNSIDLGLISIPSIFYGSEIKKGSVNLEFYYTGSLIARAQDTQRNGVLYQTYGTSSVLNQPIGLILYNEGFMILTSSAPLSDDTDAYLPAPDNPKWTYFAQPLIADGTVTAPNSAFIMNMSGTTNTQVITMLATAPKGELNHSNNPSYLQHHTGSQVSTGSHGYIESAQMRIKNIVSSSYPDPSGSFQKTTYISKIGIYDDNQVLLGIAKVATPVKKTVERDFTFKIKLDL